MPAERVAWPLALLLVAGGVGRAAAADAPVAPVDAAKTLSAAPDPELIEFLGEFSAADGFVDPFALDKVGKALEKEIETLDAEGAKAAKAPPPASKEDDHGQ